MTAAAFNAVTRPSEIPHHDGTTHLMIAPDKYATKVAVKRWLGLRAAIEKAGGHVQAIAGAFNYAYARDLCILIGDTAFHPTVPFGDRPDDLDYRRRLFLPFVEHYGYRLHGLNVLPDPSMDGGNYLPLYGRGAVIAGQFSLLGEADDINMDALRAQRLMGALSETRMTSVGASTWHIDSIAGELPDGRILVKLDEGDYEYDLKALGVKETHMVLHGVTTSGLNALTRAFGRQSLVTFSLFDNPDADVVCGVETVTKSKVAARAFALAANFTVVEGTIVGEDLPAPLDAHLKAAGMRLIGPKHVGVDSFLNGTEGLVGAARCMTLEVRPQNRQVTAASRFFM